ncbi:larval/pupal rigid cuticle protein 66-like [Ochlerotatus camptorhynchus]|uniref:larval/pupal rigid cuticle protein 66-like n=1 Tax=Ochlerotatus camptorhynchus TaxID=644619 RepID=UPI0031E3897F
MFKIITLASCLAIICSASQDHSDDWGWNGKYKFEYGVKDPHTGDHKSQWEVSDGHGGLKGGYTLDEADGTKRYVQYKADKWHGFQAIVKRIGHAVHPQSYGTPFVVRSAEKDHQKNGNGHGFEEQSNGKSYPQQQNGWVDQQASSSGSNKNGNGWKNGNGDMYATSYVKQKNY